MHYLGEDEVVQMTGSYLGEVRQGSDGNLYQWVEGIDGLGNPVGFWKRLKRMARKALPYAVPGGVALKALQATAPTLRQVLPIAQQAASRVPGGPAALRAVNPMLRQAGVAGYEGLGALYQAPDGNLYQMQGLAEDEELHGLSEDEVTQMLGMGGYVGEMRQGLDGNLYQWVAGMDGLGNPIGFWKKWKRKLRGFVKKALPIAQKLAPFIPGGAAALTAATPILQKAGIAGHNSLGALYQAPDGTVYQMQGLAEEEVPYGYGDGYGDREESGYRGNENLRGFAEAEALEGYGEDGAFYGYGDSYGEGEDLDGLAEAEELEGYGEAEELQAVEGYVRQDGVNGLGRYEPQQPPATRWFTPPGQTPESWKAPW